jgi:hypothetical protein
MRVSRPVLRGPAGAIPVGYSPTVSRGYRLTATGADTQQRPFRGGLIRGFAVDP